MERLSGRSGLGRRGVFKSSDGYGETEGDEEADGLGPLSRICWLWLLDESVECMGWRWREAFGLLYLYGVGDGRKEVDATILASSFPGLEWVLVAFGQWRTRGYGSACLGWTFMGAAMAWGSLYLGG